MVGISVIEQGSFVADRYRVVERLTRFAVADSTLTGVEYEYWLALDETRGVEVWIQVAESREVTASGAHLAGVVSALRRLNHPAIPAVLDFGEIEIEVVAEADVDSGIEDEEFVERVGYVVLEPVEAESLATVLLRGALTEAEVFAALVEIADVLKVLHEVELVHGHLSAYSFLLGERSVLLIDLAAALALETASGSELTAAADVYALAWLACVAVAGVEAVEAEFGVGFDAGSSPESAAAPQLLTLELVERRRAWAEMNLIETYGLPAELAQLLVAALGEAAGRPTAGVLATALRRRQVVSESEGAAAAAAVVAGGAVAALGAAGIAEAAQEVDVVGVADLAGAEAEAAAVEEVDVEEIGVEEVEVAEVEEAEEAGFVEAGTVAAAELAAAGLAGSAAVAEEAEVEEVALGSAGAAGTAGAPRAAGALVGAGVGASMGIAAEAMSSGGRGRGGSGGGVATASPASAPPSPPAASPSGRHGSPPNRPKSATYVAIAIVLVAVGAIVWGCSGGSGSSPAASPTGTSSTAGQATGTIPGTGSSGGASATATATAGSGVGASASAPVGGSASPSGQVTASAGASASASAGGGTGTGATPGYTPTPLATAPNSPGEALTQIKQTVSQAESNGQIPQQARGPLSGAVNTLQGEIDHGGSVQKGIAELRGALNTPGVPAGFVTQINELIPYLEQVRGS